MAPVFALSFIVLIDQKISIIWHSNSNVLSEESVWAHFRGLNAQYLALIWLFYLVKFREVHKTTLPLNMSVCTYKYIYV